MENHQQLAQQAQQQQHQEAQQQAMNVMIAQQPQMQFAQNFGLQQQPYQASPSQLGGGPDTSPSQGQSPGAYPTALAQQQQAQLTFQHLHQQHQQQLQMFWANQMVEIEQVKLYLKPLVQMRSD